MKKTIVHLEDNGQDFTELVLNDKDEILEARPFQTSIWAGGWVPLNMIEIGEQCPIHKPPYIYFGWLDHKVEKVETIED